MQNPFTRGIKDPETGEWDRREIVSRIKAAFAVLLSLAVLVGGGIFASQKIKGVWEQVQTVEDYANEAGTGDVTIDIPRGTSLTGIADILVNNNVIKTAKAFDRAAAGNSEAKKIQAGQYKLRTQIPAQTALAMLLDPKNLIRNRFQVAEGLRLSQVLTQLAKATKISEAKYKAALKDRKSLELPSWVTGKSNEGFLFPDTYELPAKPTATSVLHVMTTQFTRVTEDLQFNTRAKDLGYSGYEALVVASIIEREVFRDEDRAKVARVIYNRLKKGMPIQSDATVAYAVNKTGTIWTTAAERQTNSPYNTYLPANSGKLPPGPITAPAEKALEAAVNPEAGKWLYFQPINLDTGETEFNETYDGHLKSVAKLQAWCQASDENRKKCS